MDENKLYVGNISWNTTPEALKEAFSAAGEVISADILTDRVTGRSRGFGFVQMADEEGMQKAIEMFDGKELDGRPLRVNKAEKRERRDAA